MWIVKIKEKTITGEIYKIIFDLLDKNPDGLRWSVLLNKIQEMNPGFHPKTVNGCIWKLVEKYSDRVYKPEKGVFALKKDESKRDIISIIP